METLFRRFNLLAAVTCLLALSILAIPAHAAEPDADGDGYPDSIEVKSNSNPNDPASTPFGGKPQGPGLPINRAGARVFLDFTNTQFDNVTLFGDLMAPPDLDVKGLRLTVSLAGFVQFFQLDENGHAQTPLSVVDVRKGPKGIHFIVTIQAAKLEKLYANAGLNNSDAKLREVALDMTLFLGPVKFAATLPGLYNATANKFGRAFLGAVAEDARLKKPKAQITSVKVTPNPAEANQAVEFKGDVSVKALTGEVRGILAFGDKTPPIRTDGATLQAMLKSGISHTYATEGVFEARLAFSAENEVLATRIFVVVGKQFIVNPLNGSVSKLVKNGDGSVTLEHTVENIPDAMSAMTNFRDMDGKPIGVPGGRDARALAPGDPQVGLSVSRTFLLPGIYIAEIIPVDGNNNQMGSVKKMITISSADLGGSMAVDAAATNGGDVGVREEVVTDGNIDLTSIRGKFLFTSAKQDKVVFNGTVTLPAGFTPAQVGGNDLTVGMGNVIDTIHLNEKGKAVLPSSSGRITRFSLRHPKLPTGIATGTETGKVSMTMNVGDLDILGFDAEGITASVRSDEADQTSVQRFIQVNMLVGGRTFSVLASVDFRVTATSELGTISGRN